MGIVGGGDGRVLVCGCLSNVSTADRDWCVTDFVVGSRLVFMGVEGGKDLIFALIFLLVGDSDAEFSACDGEVAVIGDGVGASWVCAVWGEDDDSREHDCVCERVMGAVRDCERLQWDSVIDGVVDDHWRVDVHGGHADLEACDLICIGVAVSDYWEYGEGGIDFCICGVCGCQVGDRDMA